MYKKCNKCKEEKNLNLFYKKKDSKDGYTNQCKACIREYCNLNKDIIRIKKQKHNKIYYEIRKDDIIKYQKEYRELNKEKVSNAKRKYAELHALEIAEYKKRYQESNPAKMNAIRAKRRSAKLQATPSWLTKQDYKQIEEFYKEAQRLKLETGQEYHVDHIVPLQGKKVCGLHVPWNLQVLEASENRKKSNKLLEE